MPDTLTAAADALAGPLLGIGTAHRACSLALVEKGAVTRHTDELIGRGHAERLMPMLAELLGGVTANSIIVETGPGSFTGIRIGVAAARALGLAWNVPVHGISSSLLTAARAFHEGLPAPLGIVLDGGRGEVFLERFDETAASLGPPVAVPRGDLALEGIAALAGTGLELVDAPSPVARGSAAPPRLVDLVHVPNLERHLLPPQPLYVRPPDAKVPGAPC